MVQGFTASSLCYTAWNPSFIMSRIFNGKTYRPYLNEDLERVTLDRYVTVARIVRDNILYHYNSVTVIETLIILWIEFLKVKIIGIPLIQNWTKLLIINT